MSFARGPAEPAKDLKPVVGPGGFGAIKAVLLRRDMLRRGRDDRPPWDVVEARGPEGTGVYGDGDSVYDSQCPCPGEWGIGRKSSVSNTSDGIAGFFLAGLGDITDLVQEAANAVNAPLQRAGLQKPTALTTGKSVGDNVSDVLTSLFSAAGSAAPSIIAATGPRPKPVATGPSASEIQARIDLAAANARLSATQNKTSPWVYVAVAGGIGFMALVGFGGLFALLRAGRKNPGKSRKRSGGRLAALEQSLPRGWSVSTWSPGDGVTRYRFFKNASKDQNYFGPANGHTTVLGMGAAKDFARALRAERSNPLTPKEQKAILKKGGWALSGAYSSSSPMGAAFSLGRASGLGDAVAITPGKKSGYDDRGDRLSGKARDRYYDVLDGVRTGRRFSKKAR